MELTYESLIQGNNNRENPTISPVIDLGEEHGKVVILRGTDTLAPVLIHEKPGSSGIYEAFSIKNLTFDENSRPGSIYEQGVLRQILGDIKFREDTEKSNGLSVDVLTHINAEGIHGSGTCVVEKLDPSFEGTLQTTIAERNQFRQTQGPKTFN